MNFRAVHVSLALAACRARTSPVFPQPRDGRPSHRRAGRRRPLRALVAGSMLALPVSAALPLDPAAATVSGVVSTADTTGQGWYSNEPGLSPSVVGSSSFGSRWSASVSGQVYAPLIRSGSTVIAATENNEVDGLNLGDGSKLWTRSLGQPWPTSTIGCTDLTPNVGVTGRPVLSPDGSTVYLASKTYTGTDTAHPVFNLHALSVATGAELPGWPVAIAGAADNDPSTLFNPLAQLQRPALLMLNGVVYVAFGSLCDNPLARGWVAGVSTATAKLTTLWTTEAQTTATKPLGTIWEGGGELVSDGPGQIIFATGNGATPPVGSTAPHTLGNSSVRLAVGSTGKLAESDYFAPYNADTLDINDQDLGSGAPTLLPATFGTSSHPSVILQGGKEGYLYLLDAAHFGGRGATTNNVLGKFGLYGRIFSQPAVYPGEGGYVYSITSGPLLAFKNTPTTAGGPHLSKVGQSSATFYFTSSSAVVTSDGTTPGSGLVWAIQSPTKDGLNSNLVAFKAVPAGGVLTQVFSGPIGTAAKFGRPLVADNNVLVGTRTGTILDFGASATPPPPTVLVASPSSVNLGSVAVGSQSSSSFTLTNPNASAVSVTATSGPSAPFTASGPAVGTSIPANGSVTVPVAFKPTTATSSSSTVSYTTSAGTTTVTLSGTGTSGGSQVTVGDPAAGGWTLNGSAKIVSGATQLTPALAGQAGDAIYPTAVAGKGITANFTSTIGGGTGADGLTFALLDASATTPTSLGAAGDGEGFGGLPGVAVVLDTYKASTADPSSNFVGVSSNFVSSKLVFSATSTAIPALRTGTHQWQVTTDAAGTLTVSVDGALVLHTTATLPPTVYLAFTGGTGGVTDIHTVSNISATASP